MGEHTIREILRRRSPETQRALKRRRELSGVEGPSPLPKIIMAVVVLLVLAGVGYMFYVSHEVSDRFATERLTRHSDTTVVLGSSTPFLANTLLASLDPQFYSEGSGSSQMTRRLVQLYYPDAGAFQQRIMTTTLEWRYSKNDILEAYINDVPLGQGGGHTLRGFGQAAQFYFDKPFTALEPQDICLLVALIPDPAGFDPRSAPDKALAARNAVLDLDQQQGILRQTQVADLKLKPLGLSLKAIL